MLNIQGSFKSFFALSRNSWFIFAFLFVGFQMALPRALFADGNEYVFLLKGRGNVFWKTVRDGIEEAARAKNIVAIVLNTDDDQTPEAQLDQCLTSIERKPKIIVMGAATKNVGLACFGKAIAAGIPVADIDGNVTIEDAKQAGIAMSFSVASDNVLIGKLAAEFLVGATSNKIPHVLVIKGLPGSIVSEKRASGFSSRLKELLPNAVIVGSPSANWDRMKAMNTAIDFLQRDSKLDFIFSVSDVMSTGVVEAIKIAKNQRTVKLLSVDGNAEARKALLDGTMLANVAQLPYLMGKRAVEMSVEAASKQMKGYSEFTAVPVLTKEILEKKEDPNLAYLR